MCLITPTIAALAIGGVGSGISAYFGYKQSKAAEESFSKSIGFAEQEWNRFLKVFGPLQEQIVKEAKLPIEEQPGFGRMMATVDRGYSDVSANLRRTMGGRYPSGSGIETETLKSVEMERPKAKAGAVADFAMDRFNKMLMAAGMGSGISSPSGAYANLGAMQAGAARETMGSAGSGIGNLMQMYLLSKRNQKQSAQSPTYPSMFGSPY